jgi:predicted transcriptional regulator
MEVTRKEERLIIGQLILDIHRAITPEAHGTTADQHLIIVAILLDQLEGLPFNASRISRAAGVPRPTVARKIKTMVEEGFVKNLGRGLYVLPVEVLESELVLTAHEALKALIINAAESLSKMDTPPVQNEQQ